MTLTADANGEITGKFTIPADIPVGAKAVRVTGMGGTEGTATFTGRGTITIEERRRVTTITDTAFFIDPLAQTFTLSGGRHIAAIDLWFAVAGTNDVIVQIRDTIAGFPAQAVFAEQRVKPADIQPSGTHTRITFDNPVWLEGGREYAIVVLTDSAVAALHVAELGKFDANQQRWITSQPYQVGVLLSSSNAQTWTPHQTQDLTFRLLACKFAPTAKTVDLGTVAVTAASDLLVTLNVDIPATGANAEIRATAPSGEVFRMAAGLPINLPSRITGDIDFALQMSGTDTASPVVYAGAQFIAGDLQESGTYVSRAFPVGINSRVVVTFEAIIPGTSTVLVEIQDASNDWVEVPFDSGENVGDGWVERNYILPSITVTNSRIRLTMTGTAQFRPRVRKLRCVATD